MWCHFRKGAYFRRLTIRRVESQRNTCAFKVYRTENALYRQWHHVQSRCWTNNTYRQVVTSRESNIFFPCILYVQLIVYVAWTRVYMGNTEMRLRWKNRTSAVLKCCHYLTPSDTEIKCDGNVGKPFTWWPFALIWFLFLPPITSLKFLFPELCGGVTIDLHVVGSELQMSTYRIVEKLISRSMHAAMHWLYVWQQ